MVKIPSVYIYMYSNCTVECQLLGAHCTGKFFLRVVRRAWHPIAVGFSVVEHSTISASCTAWYVLWIFVHTFIHCTVMVASVMG